MQLHDLHNFAKKNKKRRGRGGKRGTYSGRGQKGQKSRAGRRIRPALRDLLIRIPKLRGVKNKAIKGRPIIISFRDLKKISGNEVSVRVLREARIIPRGFHGTVKLLGKGPLDRPLVVHGIFASASAKKAVLDAGGKVRT